jgi:hypothetical protein
LYEQGKFEDAQEEYELALTYFVKIHSIEKSQSSFEDDNLSFSEKDKNEPPTHPANH